MRHYFLVAALWTAVALSESTHPRLDPLEKIAAQKLRTYCQACHGVGDLRFIFSEDDEELWNTIHNQTAPHSKKIWASAIVEVLSWPNNVPPPFGKPITPERDWMPKGIKRLQLHEDSVNGIPSREIILQALRQ